MAAADAEPSLETTTIRVVERLDQLVHQGIGNHTCAHLAKGVPALLVQERYNPLSYIFRIVRYNPLASTRTKSISADH